MLDKKMYEHKMEKNEFIHVKLVFVLFTVIMAMLIFLVFFKFDRKNTYIGLMNEGKLTVNVLEEDFLNNLSPVVLVDNNKIDYNIDNIGNKIMDYSGQMYKEVILSYDGTDGYKPVTVINGSTTLFNDFISILKKGKDEIK